MGAAVGIAALMFQLRLRPGRACFLSAAADGAAHSKAVLADAQMLSHKIML